MGDLKEFREQAKPFTASVDVCADGALVAELEEARAELEAQHQGMLQAPKELEARVEKLAKEVDKKTRTFVFQSIGRRAWRKMLSEHPPTKEHLAMEPELDFNPDTFPAVAFRRSCISPELTQDDAEWLAGDLPEGEFTRVWGALLRANVVGGDAKKAVATAAAALSEKK